MGKESDTVNIDPTDTPDRDVTTTETSIPGREESAIYYKGKKILFVGRQESLYVAFWNSGLSGRGFSDTLVRLSVPLTSKTHLDARGLKEHLDGDLKELEAQLNRHRRPTFIRVDTTHLDFTWQSGQGRPRRPAVTGMIGDQVNMAVLKEYFRVTTQKSLPTPVIRLIQDFLKPFPNSEADFYKSSVAI